MALSLTSPHTKGKKVEEAQTLLAHNAYGRFLTAPADGDYGPLTAAATRRAKYWLGYANGSIDGNFGSTIHDILANKRKLPKRYALRRAMRKRAAAAAAAKKTVGEKMLAKAKGEIGTKEHPAGSNVVKYSIWYKMNGPWCAMFCSWLADQVGAGSKLHEAYVPTIVADARAGRGSLYVVHEPRPGDLVCYNWDGGVADHIGIYEKSTGPGAFTAIEGNTGIGNDSNGGEVMRRDRHTSTVEAFVRIK